MDRINKIILVIGPIAPPAGGISIYIQRLTYLLQHYYKFDFIDESKVIKKDVFNIRSLKLYTYLKKINQSDLLYIHSGNSLLKIFHIIIGRIFNKRAIIMFHGVSNMENKITVFHRKMYLLASKIIVVNNEISFKLGMSEKKCILQHAFLPPIMKNEIELSKKINQILAWATKNKKIIISSNASRLNIFNKTDLYGLDMCIDLAKKLKKNNHEFIILFNVALLDKNNQLYKNARKSITEDQLNDCFYLTNENISFVKLIEKTDIVLRTTNTDGDAISVREALYFDKVIIASDIVNRPFGTILFKTRNTEDLYQKTNEQIELIKNRYYKKEPNTQDKYEIIDYYKHLFEIQ